MSAQLHNALSYSLIAFGLHIMYPRTDFCAPRLKTLNQSEVDSKPYLKYSGNDLCIVKIITDTITYVHMYIFCYNGWLLHTYTYVGDL